MEPIHYPLTRFDNLYFTSYPLMEQKKLMIVQEGKAYSKTGKNIIEYIKGPKRNGKPT